MDSYEPWWLGLFASIGGWMIPALVVLPLVVGAVLIVFRSLRRRDQD
jgi:hypothetical protein